MASQLHSSATAIKKKSQPDAVHKFHFVNKDKTDLNVSLDNTNIFAQEKNCLNIYAIV